MGESLVRVEHLTKTFQVGVSKLQAVTDVSFTIDSGEVLALVGESGSGKSTIGGMLLQMTVPSTGKIYLSGEDVTHAKGRQLALLREAAQMIFQDPFASLNPAHRVGYILGRALKLHDKPGEANILELLESVGLTPALEMKEKFPHQLSGGQRQRVAIARALAVSPRFIVADEPVSMLDVSIRAEILRLLKSLQEKRGLSFLYITHDLASARYFGDRLMVLYAGKIVETGTSHAVVKKPYHPYTELLMAASPGQNRQPLPMRQAELPDLTKEIKGCAFADRCLLAIDRCYEDTPSLQRVAIDHQVACHVRVS